jgi:hypothetical protein
MKKDEALGVVYDKYAQYLEADPDMTLGEAIEASVVEHLPRKTPASVQPVQPGQISAS